MTSISTTLFSKISHASLFFTGQLRNPWQMLAKPWGSTEPRLKNTDLVNQSCSLKRPASDLSVSNHCLFPMILHTRMFIFSNSNF